MGAECCAAQSETQRPLGGKIGKLMFVNTQDDLTEKDCLEQYEQQSSHRSKMLSVRMEGQIIEEAPRLTRAIIARLATLKSIHDECQQHGEHPKMSGNEQSHYFKFKMTGIVYSGQWQDSQPHGVGKFYYPNGAYYEGLFSQGVPHGYGRFINTNGDYYEGEVKYGRGNGFGQYMTDSSSCRGEFKDNLLDGEGEQRGQDLYFKGEYRGGEKKKGVLRYGECCYEGSFENDVFDGEGKLTTEEGVYVGGFKNGQLQGYGEYRWSNGSIYRGFYCRDVREGQGEFYNSKDRSISRGMWKCGVLNGQGEYVEPRGQVRKCVWKDGKLCEEK